MLVLLLGVRLFRVLFAFGIIIIIVNHYYYITVVCLLLPVLGGIGAIMIMPLLILCLLFTMILTGTEQARQMKT